MNVNDAQEILLDMSGIIQPRTIPAGARLRCGELVGQLGKYCQQLETVDDGADLEALEEPLALLSDLMLLTFALDQRIRRLEERAAL